MLKPIFAVAVCILALMVVVKDGRVLRTDRPHRRVLSGRPAVVQGTVVEACARASSRAGPT